MNTAHDYLAEIARAGAGRFSQTSLASGHAAVTRRVRRHRTARAAATTVAGIGVIGGSTWGGMEAFARGNALAPGAIVVPSTTVSASTPPASPTAAPMATFVHVGAGWTSEQRAEFLAGAYHVSVDDAKAALAAAVADQVPEATTAEGWPMPGKFDVTHAPTVRDIANLMVSARVQELTDLGVPRADWQTVLTEASLVEAETHVTSDMPKVARVIDNRLATGLKLELDSTVKYVMDTTGAFNQEDQVVTDSPYNTYLNPGLPPGAIANPSDEAVRAVLNPAEGDWLFFVTVNLDTGEMAYATTFEDHQKNVQKLQTWIAAQPHS